MEKRIGVLNRGFNTSSDRTALDNILLTKIVPLLNKTSNSNQYSKIDYTRSSQFEKPTNLNEESQKQKSFNSSESINS